MVLVRETAREGKQGAVLSLEGREVFLTRQEVIDLYLSLSMPLKEWGWYREHEGFDPYMPSEWRFLNEGERLEKGDQYGVGIIFKIGEDKKTEVPTFSEGLPITKAMLSAFPRRRRNVCQTCHEEIGIKRVDNGLGCGIHCNGCFDKLVSEARSKSW